MTATPISRCVRWSACAFCFLAAALATTCPAAWPTRPIHLVVPFGPGGPTDIVARVLSQSLSEALGQPVIVENRAGASGNIGAAAVARSVPDGYTVLVTNSSLLVNESLFPEAGYEMRRDFVPCVVMARQPTLIIVNNAFPAKTLGELLAMGRGSAFATPGSGSPGHLTGESLFNLHAKLAMTPVHFRSGSLAATAVLAGEPPVGSVAAAAPLALIKSGKVRALAVSSAHRLAMLPEVPTLSESGFPSLQDYLWVGVFLPIRTSPEIVARLNTSINRIVNTAEFRERLEAQSYEAVGGSLVDTARFVQDESDKWRRIVRETGAKPE